MATAASVITLITQLVPSLMTIVTQALAAAQAGDQATLDSLHAQATAAANALAPAD